MEPPKPPAHPTLPTPMNLTHGVRGCQLRHLVPLNVSLPSPLTPFSTTEPGATISTASGDTTACCPLSSALNLAHIPAGKSFPLHRSDYGALNTCESPCLQFCTTGNPLAAVSSADILGFACSPCTYDLRCPPTLQQDRLGMPRQLCATGCATNQQLA